MVRKACSIKELRQPFHSHLPISGMAHLFARAPATLAVPDFAGFFGLVALSAFSFALYYYGGGLPMARQQRDPKRPANPVGAIAALGRGRVTLAEILPACKQESK